MQSHAHTRRQRPGHIIGQVSQQLGREQDSTSRYSLTTTCGQELPEGELEGRQESKGASRPCQHSRVREAQASRGREDGSVARGEGNERCHRESPSLGNYSSLP